MIDGSYTNNMATPLEKSTPKVVSQASARETTPKETASEDHERDEIEFVDPLPDELKCSICLLVFKDPILTDCGHLFCQACIAPVSSRNPRCPLCNEEGFRTFPDKRTIRKIRSLKIKCKKRVEGCEWVGEYGRLEHHLDPKEGDCEFVEAECDFYPVGCTTRSLRKDLPQHMEANTHKHLILMSTVGLKAGGETERQLQERRAELLQQQLQKKEEETQRRFVKLEGELKEKDEQIEALQGRVEKQLQKREEDAQRRFKEKDEQIKALKGRVESLEQQFRCPPCEFIMRDFSKHKAADDEWLSPHFYSHPGGYKQRLAVYANGCDHKGTQVSFEEYIMQGEYDNLLQWPKGLSNYIFLLNHNTGDWDKDVGAATWSTKPQAAQERHNSSETLPNSELGKYLKNDCIHFRVTKVHIS